MACQVGHTVAQQDRPSQLSGLLNPVRAAYTSKLRMTAFLSPSLPMRKGLPHTDAEVGPRPWPIRRCPRLRFGALPPRSLTDGGRGVHGMLESVVDLLTYSSTCQNARDTLLVGLPRLTTAAPHLQVRL